MQHPASYKDGGQFARWVQMKRDQGLKPNQIAALLGTSMTKIVQATETGAPRHLVLAVLAVESGLGESLDALNFPSHTGDSERWRFERLPDGPAWWNGEAFPAKENPAQGGAGEGEAG